MSTTTAQVAILRAGAWTARGLRVPARNALLADMVPAEAYGSAYGFERAMDNLGAIIGPLVAIVLVGVVGTRWRDRPVGHPRPARRRSRSSTPFATPPTPHERHRQPIRLRIRPVMQGQLGKLMLGIIAFEIGNCAATLLILRATELFEPGRTVDRATQLALVLYVAYNLAATLVSVPAGHHADRRGATRVMAAGAARFACAYAWFAVGPSEVIVLAPAFVLAGVGIACAETAEHAAVAALAPTDLRGSAFGLLAGIQAGRNLAASTIAGILWTAASPDAAFIFLAVP